MRECGDFHIHYSPKEVSTGYEAVNLARQAGVSHMALLARSEVSPELGAYKEYGNIVGVKVESGIELCTSDKGTQVDLIGIGFDHDNFDIVNAWGPEAGKEKAKLMAMRQVTFLQEMGFTFANLNGHTPLFNQVMSGELTERAIALCKIISHSPANRAQLEEVKRQHADVWSSTVERYATKPEYADMVEPKFLYNTYFGFGKPGNFNRLADTERSIDLIQSAGGAVLYSPEGSFNMDIWRRLHVLGVDGIMAWHGGAIDADIPRSVLVTAHQSGMLVLGGSDYQQRDWQVGTGKGSMYISPARGRELEQYLQKVRVPEIDGGDY